MAVRPRFRANIVIDVPPESQVHRQVVRKAASARPITMDPATRIVLVEVQEPDMHEPSGDLERLKAALAEQWDITDVAAPLHVLQTLQPRAAKGQVAGQRRTAPPREQRAPRHPRCVAGPARRRALWPRHRPRLHHHRSTSVRSDERGRPCLGRRHEPADPLRRGPDEPGQLRDDEPRRRPRDDAGRARRDRRPGDGVWPGRPGSTRIWCSNW